MPHIFISYSRSDSPLAADAIQRELAERFGSSNVFKDLKSVGRDFRSQIEDEIRQSDAIVLLIGRNFLHSTAQTDFSADYVRQEVEAGLRLGVPVVTVLVEGASMPRADDLPSFLKPLASRNVLSLRPGREFSRDIQKLIAIVEDAPHGLTLPPIEANSTRDKTKSSLAVAEPTDASTEGLVRAVHEIPIDQTPAEDQPSADVCIGLSFSLSMLAAAFASMLAGGLTSFLILAGVLAGVHAASWLFVDGFRSSRSAGFKIAYFAAGCFLLWEVIQLLMTAMH
jgi:hypothetical protein